MEQYVNSPTLPSDEGIVKSDKEFSDALTLDLTDDEIKMFGILFQQVRGRYYGRRYDTLEQGVKIVEEMEKEMQTVMAERLSILCRFDVSPMIMGQPPIFEVMGRIPGHSIEKYGFDHEKKEYEVKKATARDEDYLGQKGEENANRARRRALNKKERRAKRAAKK